ncbi:MAG: LuxR family transcriptional regulator [Bacteroidales bacterium]|nr:LuxR family transcriptional regulator [Bacteroidales bacterium]
MRKNGIILLLIVFTSARGFAYNDHRGHNLDSLERVVAHWTPDAIDKASDTELVTLNRAFRDLMLGYSALNGEKCIFYARKALSISEPRGWEEANADAYRYIGQCLWAEERYDSSLVYYNKALAAVERMAGGAISPTNPEGYSEKEVDDTRSALYGAIGNLYNMMDSIPQAMDYYARAGAIFDKYGWNQSNAILYYNIGETWVEQGNLRKATQAYEKSLAYAQGDSLMVAMAQKGLGRVYMEEGKTWKALRYLHQADAYFSAHDKEELSFTKENYEYMSAALLAQRRQMMLIGGGAILLLLLLLAVLLIGKKLQSTRKEQAEVSAVLEETIREVRSPACDEEVPQLSEREKEILDLLAKGYTTPQIANGVGLSPETVKWYRKKLLVKFDVSNTAELISQVNKMMYRKEHPDAKLSEVISKSSRHAIN